MPQDVTIRKLFSGVFFSCGSLF